MSESPPELPDDLVEQLLALIDRLCDETRTFLDQPGDQQAWYNRGYANGMVKALQGLVRLDRLDGRDLDDAGEIGTHMALPWGKAYRHGESMGCRETHEITGSSLT